MSDLKRVFLSMDGYIQQTKTQRKSTRVTFTEAIDSEFSICQRSVGANTARQT